MNEVRFIQKIGQVPMAELVENAARLGFVLAGSPTLVSNVPAQLMIQADKPAVKPEYVLVEKTGQLKLSDQVEALLDQGWEIYGSMLAGEVPMQAMVRGDISVHSMYGMGSGGEGPGPAPADWQKEIARVDESLTEIYAVINDTPDPQAQIDQLSSYMEQRFDDSASAMRGEVIGLNLTIDEKHEESKQFTRDAVDLLNQKVDGMNSGQNKEIVKLQMRASDNEKAIGATDQSIQQMQMSIDGQMTSFAENFNAQINSLVQDNLTLADRIVELETKLEMEAEERRQDVARLEDMMSEMLRLIPRTGTETTPGSAWQQ